MRVTDLPAELLDECALLYVDTFAAPPWNESWRPEDARQRLVDFRRTPRAHGAAVLDDDDRLQGFAIGHLERNQAADHFCLQEMCVRPASQRAGYGSALLGALEERLPGVSHWYLLTARDSPAAAFYARHGFRPAGRMSVFVRTPPASASPPT
ncbi:GNAT family N-acetyltransferase [Angustibacter luteus]|uniref:GNAT family N-acetyltransferase n=1 Tax=Angustibacter luteus TaxID=658456 RepID=A0ABW1JJH6_9ACTN